MGSYQQQYNELKKDQDLLQVRIEEAVRMNREAIETDILRQAQTFMSWAYMHALAERDAKRLKLNLEEDVLVSARAKAETQLLGEDKRPTIQAKDDIAHQDPSYKQAQAIHIKAETLALVLKRVLEAMTHKRDMLQSLNSRQKVELTALPTDWIPPNTGPADDGYDAERGAKLNAEAEADPDTTRGWGTPELRASKAASVESDCAELARNYRSMRRESRNEQ